MTSEISDEIRQRRIKWADKCEALGDKQAHMQLRSPRGDAFCCLGVAEQLRMDTCGMDSWIVSASGMYGILVTTKQNYDSTYKYTESSTLTPDTMKWLGFDTTNPIAATAKDVIDILGDELDQIQRNWLTNEQWPSGISFATLNDDLKLTLPQIAKIIRALHT